MTEMYRKSAERHPLTNQRAILLGAAFAVVILFAISLWIAIP